jgi:hypothetical protein
MGERRGIILITSYVAGGHQRRNLKKQMED